LGGEIIKKMGRFIKKSRRALSLNQWSVKYSIFRPQKPLDIFHFLFI
jgi:hypothetical protein